jgi:bacteriocin-like protein
MGKTTMNPEALAGDDTERDETLNDDELEQVSGGPGKIGVGVTIP